MTRIIVTDGNTRTALATVRSLGRAGFEVIVVGVRKETLAGRSRYAVSSWALSGPEEDASGFVGQLAALADSVGADFVLPVTDASVGAILRHGGTMVGSAEVIAPQRDAYEALSDKAGLLIRARTLGVHVPRTEVAVSAAELEGAASRVGFPCVLKPHRSVVIEGGSAQHACVSYATDLADLAGVAARYPLAAYPILVQERILGRGEGVFLLMDQGRLIAAFAHRRIREYPVSGGASTYREGVRMPEDLLAASERILRSVAWSGAAMVEFKRSAANDRAYLMEVNGRLWGSLKLAIDAGVDFPVLLARLALGETVTPVGSYRAGLRCRWFWGEVNHLLDRLQHTREELDLPLGAPSRLRALIEFLIWRPWQDRFEIFAWTDPQPFVFESREWFVGRIRRVFSG